MNGKNGRMSGAIRVHETGGPEVLKWEQVAEARPGPGQIRIRHSFAGLNFIDVYHRTGLYKQALPFTPGMEGAGVVTEVGEGVSDLRVGDRVAYAGGATGAYAEERVFPAERAVRLPSGIDERTAAAMMLKGMTAQYLLRQTIRVERGDTILFHAAAGGVGLIACQWAKHLGATVIGTVGNEDKAKLALANGCDHVIIHGRDDLVARVKELTGGKGVRVVYDGIGKDTFMQSLDCLQVRGLLALFGQSSGAVTSFDPGLLASKGCLYLTRPSLFPYTATREALLATAEDLFAVVGSGAVKISIAQTFALREAAAAHRALEGRKTVGSTVLEI
jgi:NADPH2:quinone reductase